MVLVPAGVNEGVDPDFGPYKLVSPGFYMDRSEITYSQWKRVRDWALDHGYRFANPGSGKGDDHPVHSVSWYDCAKWCNARSEMEGLVPVYYFQDRILRDASPNHIYDPDIHAFESNSGYRLPSRDQWDYAARGGTSGTRFPWGNEISRENANYGARDRGVPAAYDHAGKAEPARSDDRYDPRFLEGGSPFTAPAGTFPPNGYGLTEMIGNVSEWISDTDYTALAWEAGSYGGSWWEIAEACRFGRAVGAARSHSAEHIGFRTVRPAGARLSSNLSVSSDDLPDVRHPDRDQRRSWKVDGSDLRYDDNGWEMRYPTAETIERVESERRKHRNPDNPGVWGPAYVAPLDAPSPAPQPAARPAPPPAAKPEQAAKPADARPPVGFRVRRADADRADLVVIADEGSATVTPNVDFSFGQMRFSLLNRTKHHIVLCCIRVAFEAGGGSDVWFSDIPPGEERQAAQPFALVGASAGRSVYGTPFLFPALVLAVKDGKPVDLYEEDEPPSVGYVPLKK